MSAARDAKLRESVDGLEKFCTRCREWWPADGEFFFKGREHDLAGLFYCCKACYAEMDRRPGRTGHARAVSTHAALPLTANSIDFLLGLRA